MSRSSFIPKSEDVKAANSNDNTDERVYRRADAEAVTQRVRETASFIEARDYIMARNYGDWLVRRLARRIGDPSEVIERVCSLLNSAGATYRAVATRSEFYPIDQPIHKLPHGALVAMLEQYEAVAQAARQQLIVAEDVVLSQSWAAEDVRNRNGLEEREASDLEEEKEERAKATEEQTSAPASSVRPKSSKREKAVRRVA